MGSVFGAYRHTQVAISISYPVQYFCACFSSDPGSMPRVPFWHARSPPAVSRMPNSDPKAVPYYTRRRAKGQLRQKEGTRGSAPSLTPKLQDAIGVPASFYQVFFSTTKNSFKLLGVFSGKKEPPAASDGLDPPPHVGFHYSITLKLAQTHDETEGTQCQTSGQGEVEDKIVCPAIGPGRFTLTLFCPVTHFGLILPYFGNFHPIFSVF